jgi:uncharacterized protein YndB with AHSA1/START domain
MSIFSHAVAPEPRGGPLADISCSSAVPVAAVEAYNGFTEYIHLWWPSGLLSVWGAEGFFSFEAGALVETSPQEEEVVWAETTEAEPGRQLELLWRPQDGQAGTTALTVSFAAAPTCTGVSLAHGGWTADLADAHAFYARFWPDALEAYTRFMGARDE